MAAERPARAAKAAAFTIRTDADAAEFVSAADLVALTTAATAATFEADWLSEDQRAANRETVARSAAVCLAAARSRAQLFAAAFDPEGLAGFVVATRHGPGDHELDWLMVHPRVHGTGIADALMLRGVEWLGADRPIWLNVLRHNERAIRFYRRFGFSIDHTAPAPHAIPQWIMRRPPSPLDPRR